MLLQTGTSFIEITEIFQVYNNRTVVMFYSRWLHLTTVLHQNWSNYGSVVKNG